MLSVVVACGVVASGSLVAWLWLVLARGRFWRTDQELNAVVSMMADERDKWPSVSVIIPARDEADLLPITLPTLLTQDYPGQFDVYLVDDGSSDGTGNIAAQAARQCDASDRLTVCSGKILPPGWKGKVWAMRQGILRSEQSQSECLLLTDADITYAPGILRAIVRKLRADRLELVSLMAKLHVVSAWDRLLLPAFVYFFSKLYPFRFVNDPNKAAAGAAGGCVLLRRKALQDAGGLKQISNEIIDDCALAKLIKGSGGRIWMGMTDDVNSIRPYERLVNIWNTVARTAFDQLGYSVTALLGTVLGMLFVYLVPPVASIIGAIAVATIGLSGVSLWLLSVCFFAWALMSMSYLPILRRYRVSYLFALLLPVSAMVYTAMTVSSALRYWQGHGGEWKGRTYERAFRRRSG